MIEELSDFLTYWLIKNKILSIEKREIYSYAIEVLLLNLSILIVNLGISILTGTVIHFIEFLVFFIPLRMLSGGYHCKHSGSCLILSVFVYALTIGIMKYEFDDLVSGLIVLLSIVAGGIIIKWAPLINVNHPLAEYQIKRNRKLILGIVSVDYVFIIFFYRYNIEILRSEQIFILLIAILLVAGTIEKNILAIEKD